MPGETQMVSVRVYETADRIMLAAPMPGIQPDDISVVVHSRRVELRGRERGPRQHDLNLVMTEWTFGPYRREVELPEPVQPPLTNATYDNGVLVLVLPKRGAAAGDAPGHDEPVEIRLEGRPGARGEHVGHVGRDVAPASTPEHQAAKGRRGSRAPSSTASAPADTEPRVVSGYAHLNVWRLGSADNPADPSAAQAMAEQLRQQPGFRSYTVVRTGEHEVAVLTVFDSESQLTAALDATSEVVEGAVRPLAAARPERRAGPVLHHEAAA